MKRVAVLFLGIVVIGLAPTFASAMGFMPAGLPSFGNFFGGPASCGEGFGPKCPGPTFYAGWMFGDRPVGLSASTDNINLGGVTDLTHNYKVQGVWLGLSQTLPLSDYFSILGSAWYMIPDSGGHQESVELYNNAIARRSWDTRNDWWYADGLLAISCGRGGALLAGVRYDFFTTRFRNPRDVIGVTSRPSDQADLISNNVIPLVGVQWAHQTAVSNLIVRAVGIPTLVGTVKYQQPFAGTFGLEASGNWRNGYFFEFFAEANHSFSVGGPKIGVFARYNAAHGNVDLDIDFQGLGIALTNETFHTGFTRNTWTIGGNFQLDFGMPF